MFRSARALDMVPTIIDETDSAAQRIGTVTGGRCGGAGRKVNTGRIIAHTITIANRYE
jgi:hypothetical protein